MGCGSNKRNSGEVIVPESSKKHKKAEQAGRKSNPSTDGSGFPHSAKQAKILNSRENPNEAKGNSIFKIFNSIK